MIEKILFRPIRNLFGTYTFCPIIIHFYFLPGARELSEISEPIQVIGAGGVGTSEGMPYKLSLAKDHPKGEEPIIIKDDSKDFTKFTEVMNFVKYEKQILILVEGFSEKTHKEIAGRLPKKSYTEHHGYKYDNNCAAAWVEHHLTRHEDDITNENFRFLIGDWQSAAGYEVPAVIFVTKEMTYSNMPTHVQRAKAKLVIYHAPNLEQT